MRVPLKVTSYDAKIINIHTSNDHISNYRGLSWFIRDMKLAPTEEAEYRYTFNAHDENKFYENGCIYNAEGFLADNTLLTRDFRFHGFCHASLNKMLEQPAAHFQYNFMYSLRVGKNINLKRIAAVRERLNIPDWLALLVFSKIVSEDSVCALLAEVPDLFSAYSYDWVLRVLGVNEEKIHAFDNTQKGYGFQNFCKVIELEQQYISSELKTGTV